MHKAETVWKSLNGILCVYKPPDASVSFISKKLKNNLCKDLNSLETTPPKPYVEVNRSSSGISINVRPSYADNILCAGPRYQPRHIQINFLSALTPLMSGVQLVSINEGWRLKGALRNCQFTKCFHVKGIMGEATADFHVDGKVVGRAKYDHIERKFLERILASYQSANQRRIFEEYNIDLKSQEAYEFAVKGLYRPTEKGTTAVYGLKLVEFEPPDFTIEVQCAFGTEDYLKNLIHNIGVSLKCLATCSGIRCIRHGCFHIQDSLLCKDWTVFKVIDNMNLCLKNLEDHFPETVEYSSIVCAKTVDPVDSVVNIK